MVTAEQVLEAKGIAHVASVAMYNKIGGDRFACGFAWVNVYVDRTNSKQAKELIKAGFKKDYRPKCLSMWNPGDVNVQNVDIKEAGASAMAEYLRALGLNAYAGSRLD
jgi:4-hydroxyphenylpyruvate dioxygenase-like putative hemolysin